MFLRYFLFILIFAFVFALIGHWIYLAIKKAKKIDEYKWNDINRRIDDEYVELDKGTRQKTYPKTSKTLSKNKRTSKTSSKKRK